jgi:two-component system response regulator CpxR
MNPVLLADDDIELCELLADYLGAEGFQTHTLHDGESALRQALTQCYEVMVLDVMLPRLSGFEVLRRLRTQSQLPVLMLTARGDCVDRVVGLEIGADDYLPKPFDPRELVARLRAILRRVQPGSGPDMPMVLRIGDLELRIGERSVLRRGQAVALTSAEFSVLKQLMLAVGRIVPRAALTEQALGRKLTRFDRSIDVHVSNLRKKLGPAPEGEMRIKTVRNIGYLYCAALTNA